MPTLLATQCEAILDAATRSDLGIRVHVQNATAFTAKQALYRFRRELGAGAYRHLQIWLSPTDPDHELWVVNRPDLVPQESETVADTSPPLDIEF